MTADQDHEETDTDEIPMAEAAAILMHNTVGELNAGLSDLRHLNNLSLAGNGPGVGRNTYHCVTTGLAHARPREDV